MATQKLSRIEVMTLQNFTYKIDDWRARFGDDKASKVEITYYPEDDGFEFANGEENNGILKRNRTTAFRAEIASWAVDNLERLKGWNKENKVTAFVCSYDSDRFSCQITTEPNAKDEPQADAEPSIEQA